MFVLYPRISRTLPLLDSTPFVWVFRSATSILGGHRVSLTAFRPNVKSKEPCTRSPPEQRGANLGGSIDAAPRFSKAIDRGPPENDWGGTIATSRVRIDFGAYSPLCDATVDQGAGA